MASSTKADLLKIADDARNYEKAADAAIARTIMLFELALRARLER